MRSPASLLRTPFIGNASVRTPSLANPPFQVEGPPCPIELPFYQTEALRWLLFDRVRHMPAGDRFRGVEEAIEGVKQLYDVRVTCVDSVVASIDRHRGRDYSAELEVTSSKEKAETVVTVIGSLRPENWEMGLDEDETADSRYDGCLHQVEASPDSDHTITLWWE